MDRNLLLNSVSVLSSSRVGISTFRSLVNSLAIRGQLDNDCSSDCNMDNLISELELCKSRFLEQSGRVIKKKFSDLEIPKLGFGLPSDWRLVSLDKLCFAQAGFAFSAANFNTDGIGLPLIRIRDIDRGFSETFYSGEYRPEFLVHKGDWLIGMDGNFNVRQWKGESALLNQRVTRLVFFDDRMNQKFISLALEEHLHSLMGTKSYTTVDHLSTKQIESAPIPLPCIEVQDRIISQLDNLETQIDKLDGYQESMRRLGLAAKKSAVDAISTAQTQEEFDIAWERIKNNWEVFADSCSSINDLRILILSLAVNGKLASPTNGGNSAADELASVDIDEVREIFTGKDSHSNVYPKNWAVASFPNIGKWVAGIGFPTEQQGHTGKEILFCKVSDMNLPTNSKYLIEANNTIELSTAKNLRATILKEGTVVFPKIGGAIATNKRRIIVKPTIVDNNCMGIEPCSVIDPEWLYILLSSIDFVKYQSGTSIPSISQRTLDQIRFGVPPLNEQKLIVDKVNYLMQICDELRNGILEKDKVAENFARSIVSASA